MGYSDPPSAEVFEVDVDTDFAGCGQTRQSTSSGTILYHGHCVKHWSVAQSPLSSSSGESELHGISKGVSTALGCNRWRKTQAFKRKSESTVTHAQPLESLDIEVWYEFDTSTLINYRCKPRLDMKRTTRTSLGIRKPSRHAHQACIRRPLEQHALEHGQEIIEGISPAAPELPTEK